MSNQHKHPTISFRINDAERKQIEARILASGMMKKDYFVRSCIYNRICVVGKKETIYPLVQTVNALYLQLLEIQKAFTNCCNQQNLSNLPTCEITTKAAPAAAITYPAFTLFNVLRSFFENR